MIFFRIAGILLIVLPITCLFAFFALRRTFEYPGIRRRSADYILNRYAEGGPRLVALWYVFALSAVLIIPMSLFFQLVFVEQHRYLASSSAIVGALSGLVQAAGLLFWVFLVRGLAKQYRAATAAQEAVAAHFHVFY